MKRGFAIILVLATLVLLAMLSLTYIKLALIDRNIARNYVDNKRAKLIAQSGVDYAIARLQDTLSGNWRYDKLDLSFATGTITVNGQLKGYSQSLGSSYGQNSDLFDLKILDTQSRININDGSNISNTHYTSLNLQRILNILGMQITPNPVTNLGDRIIPDRPPGGYTNKNELIKILGYEDYKSVEDFITVNSWTNDSVAVPVPLSNYLPVEISYPFFDSIARPTNSVTGLKIYRYGHNLNWEGIDISNYPGKTDEFKKLIFADPAETTKIHGVYSTDALNPQWIELTQRSPVNINTASPEVLKALLIDLEGFFVMERRSPNPPIGDNLRWPYFAFGPDSRSYAFMKPKYTYDKDTWSTSNPSDPEFYGYMSDELGFLYKTIPYFGTGGRNASGIDAERIALEIIACRKREGGYSSVNFGGPFKSWAQFNLFVDKLVEDSIIIDNRNYFDVLQTADIAIEESDLSAAYLRYKTPPPVSQGTSYVQKRLASVAAGDVLKANFNPNLHLNELNPDRQLFTMVDKTDLIVNSTEFCFTPMGSFEIESTGYVLLPQGTKDSLTAGNNQIIARSKIEAVVKLFDVYYETSQDKFYQGSFSDRVSFINTSTTNNNCAIETGPEVDNGSAIVDTEYDGYVRLSTNLGCFSGATKKPKDKLWTTYSNNDEVPKYSVDYALPALTTPDYSESLHSHFQLDHVAHYHSGGANAALPMGSIRITDPQDLGSPTPDPAATVGRYNFPDKSESRRSPYSPVDDQSRYRLCRSFKSTQSIPPGELYAPSDLRVDGVYVEPHSAFGYDTVNFTTEATVAFWIKPNWFPDSGGRIRTFTSMRKYMLLKSNDLRIEWPCPFDIIFMPCNPAANDMVSNRNLFFAAYADSVNNYAYPNAASFTNKILNHEFETATETWDRFKGNDNKFNYLRNREWIFMIVRFYHDDIDYGGVIGTQPTPAIKIYLNNTDLTYHKYLMSTGPFDFSTFIGPYITIGGDFSSFCATNKINIKHGFYDHWGHFYPDNPESYSKMIFYADSTIDEFFFWADNSNGVSKAMNIGSLGRYYKPQDSEPSDAVFTSQLVTLTQAKSLQAESTISPPAAAEEESTISPPDITILGISWTYFAEDYLTGTEADGTARLKPVMWDWKNLFSDIEPYNIDLNDDDARSLCDIKLNINDVDSGTYDDDGYSAVNINVNPGDRLKYKVKFNVGSRANLDTILLASPVFDDITIYYTSPVRYVAYTYFD